MIRLDQVDLQDVPRFSSGFAEFDRVLGGGIVPGSAILIGGSPGAGKSTLLLQIMCGLADQQASALYVTGEESLQQVALRAHRLGLPTSNLMMLAETNVETICQLAQQEKPRIMVIDSIQVMQMMRYSVCARQCVASAGKCGLFDPFCQAAQCGGDYGWPCHQRWFFSWP